MIDARPLICHSQIEHVAESVWLSRRDRSNVMAMYTAYFDESDTESASVVAGLVSSVERWEAFDADWSSILQSEAISAFHMKDYAHSNGEFASWKGDEDRRRDLLQQLISIIAQHCEISVGVCIDRRAFEYRNSTLLFDSSFFNTEYAACSCISIIRVGNWARATGIDSSIAFVFDAGNAKRHEFDQVYQAMKSVARIRTDFRLGTLTFADDRDVTPLQAADMVAYEISKAYTDVRGATKRKRKSFSALLDALRVDWPVVTSTELERVAGRMRELFEHDTNCGC